MIQAKILTEGMELIFKFLQRNKVIRTEA